MRLIHGTDIKSTIRDISPTSIAVAYVGIDWASYVSPDRIKEIILSPTLGSNPYAIVNMAKYIGWENIYFLDNLHAKIYLSASQAAVGSFNLTANGLSAQGLEEAGFFIEEKEEIDGLRVLIEKYKDKAKFAYPTTESKLERLAELRALWDRAVKTGGIRNDSTEDELKDYQPVASDEFYVCCVWGEIEYSEQVIFPTTIKDSVSFLEGDEIQPDRWILCWYARNDGYPDHNRKPYWLHVDEVISNGAVHVQYTKIAVERNDRSPLFAPFELTPTVISALWTVLNSDRFLNFLGNVEPWSISATLPLLPVFLQALKEELVATSNSSIMPIEPLRQAFSNRIREAMDISLRKKYVTHSIDGMLSRKHAVEVAKQLVQPGAELKSGLKKLAKANALPLSFESIMLEKQFQPLFSKHDLEYARFNLLEISPTYLPPERN